MKRLSFSFKYVFFIYYHVFFSLKLFSRRLVRRTARQTWRGSRNHGLFICTFTVISFEIIPYFNYKHLQYCQHSLLFAGYTTVCFASESAGKTRMIPVTFSFKWKIWYTMELGLEGDCTILVQYLNKLLEVLF